MKKEKSKLELVKEKLNDPKIKKKYEKLISDLEKLLESKIKLNIMLDGNDLDNDDPEYDNGMVDENFWNSYGVTLKELLDYRIDIMQKEIYITDDIDIEGPEYLDVRIKILQRLGQTYEGNEHLPITINVSSYGGDVYSAFGMLDIINNIETDVIMQGRGQIMSAGGLLLCCSKAKRVMSKNSILMLHDVQAYNFGSYKEIKDNYEHLTMIQDKLYTLLGENSNKDKKYWESKLQRDVFFTAEEALSLNLIDEIR